MRQRNSQHFRHRMRTARGVGPKIPRREGRAGHSVSLQDSVSLAMVPTPMAGTPAQNGNNEAGNNDYSRKIVELATLPTPQTHDDRERGNTMADGHHYPHDLSN